MSQEVEWTSTFTHRCRDCLGTVQVVDFKPQPHDCQPRVCGIGDCNAPAVGIIVARHHDVPPAELSGPGTPGVTLLCDRHFSTAPVRWDDEA